jgi:hypothetical protein
LVILFDEGHRIDAEIAGFLLETVMIYVNGWTVGGDKSFFFSIDSVTRRRNLHDRHTDREDWHILEKQELERFCFKSVYFAREMQEKHPECFGKIDVFYGERRMDIG